MEVRKQLQILEAHKCFEGKYVGGVNWGEGQDNTKGERHIRSKEHEGCLKKSQGIIISSLPKIGYNI